MRKTSELQEGHTQYTTEPSFENIKVDGGSGELARNGKGESQEHCTESIFGGKRVKARVLSVCPHEKHFSI